MDNNLLPTVTTLDEKTNAIARQLMDESDSEKVKELTALFNLNAQKRNVVRVMKMSGLLDKVTDQVIERFEKTPNNFSNDELLRYMQAAEASIDKATKSLSAVEETPAIVQNITNNTQLNVISDEGLNRESRQRVFDAVRMIMGMSEDISTSIEQEDEFEEDIEFMDEESIDDRDTTEEA